MFLEVYARCDADQLQPPLRQAEQAALGDIDNGLAGLQRVLRVEGYLLDILDETLDSTFLGYRQAFCACRFLKATCRQSAAEEQVANAMDDVGEAAAAGQHSGELADVDIA